MCVRAEGGGVLDTDYSAINAEDSYISDMLNISFTKIILNPANDVDVYITPVITRAYDDSVVTSYNISVLRDGIYWKSFDETNYTTEFYDAAAGGEHHTYSIQTAIDNTYDITDFDDTAFVVTWYSSGGGGGGGGGFITTPTTTTPITTTNTTFILPFFQDEAMFLTVVFIGLLIFIVVTIYMAYTRIGNIYGRVRKSMKPKKRKTKRKTKRRPAKRGYTKRGTTKRRSKRRKR
jgi:hypothetical protein